jgi:hypothetical protein
MMGSVKIHCAAHEGLIKDLEFMDWMISGKERVGPNYSDSLSTG